MRDARDSRTSAALTALIAIASTCGAMRGQNCTFDWAKGFGLPGLDGTINASMVFNDGIGDPLYVGGEFAVAGDTVAANIARWDGAEWSVLSRGMNDRAHALTVFDDGGNPAAQSICQNLSQIRTAKGAIT